MPVRLTIVADDFGLSPAYDRGMLEAAEAGAIDGAGVMVRREPDSLPELLATGIDVGLHLEAAGEALTADEIAAQLTAFELAAGRPSDYIDGHHHCHAGAASRLVAEAAGQLGLPVRSIDREHRALLRAAGVATSDLLIGRYSEDEPVLPAEAENPPADVATIEWMVHPGHPDPAAGSSYDAGREEDLAAVLSFVPRPPVTRFRRASR